MFSSVFSTIKSQTEKLKESFNKSVIIRPEQIQSFSTRLKDNVVQTSNVLRSSVAQNIQGFISTANSSLSSTNDSLSSRPEMFNCDKNEKNRNNVIYKQTSIVRQNRSKGTKNEIASLKWPLLENGNKTWVELVEIPTVKSKANHNSPGYSAENISDSASTDSIVEKDTTVINGNEVDFFSDDEDENITQKFTRITGIGYRASKVNPSYHIIIFC